MGVGLGKWVEGKGKGRGKGGSMERAGRRIGMAGVWISGMGGWQGGYGGRGERVKSAVSLDGFINGD